MPLRLITFNQEQDKTMDNNTPIYQLLYVYVVMVRYYEGSDWSNTATFPTKELADSYVNYHKLHLFKGHEYKVDKVAFYNTDFEALYYKQSQGALEF